MFSTQFSNLSPSTPPPSSFTKSLSSETEFSIFDNTSKDEEKKKIQRQKNNEAVKRCREARRQVEKSTVESLENQRKINEDLERFVGGVTPRLGYW